MGSKFIGGSLTTSVPHHQGWILVAYWNSQLLQGYQAYSQLYYDTKLKGIIDKKYKEHTETVPKEEQTSWFAFSTSLTKVLFERETNEIKVEVDAYWKKEVTSKEIKLDNESDSDDLEHEKGERNCQMQKWVHYLIMICWCQ